MTRSDDSEGDLMGPGVDLAMSLSGVLMIVVVVVSGQLFLASAATRQLEPSDGMGEIRASIVRMAAELKAARKKADAEKQRAIAAEKELTRAAANLAAQKAQIESLSNELKITQDKVLVLEGKLAAEIKRRSEAEATTKAATQQAGALSKDARDLASQINDLKAKLTDKPPLITISDATFRTFEEASAELSPQLKQFLRDSIRQLYESRNRYGATVIEVVGHTDEIKLGKKIKQACNLDEMLLSALNGPIRVGAAITPCDNVGLGMARATAVVNELTRLGLRKDFILLPLSAGAAIDVNGQLASGSNLEVALPARRRIEIRLRRE